MSTDPDAPAPRPVHRQLPALGLVLVGGAVGTLARYGLARVLPTDGWSWATFAANLAAALILGALLTGLAARGDDVGARQRWRLLGATGFCGGFSTYSTFAVEVDLLIDHGATGTAVGYLAATLAGGVVAVVLGSRLATRR